MFPFIVTTLPGVYLITVNYADAFVFGFLTTLLLAVGVPWMAHLPQPKPGRAVWTGVDHAWKQRQGKL